MKNIYKLITIIATLGVVGCSDYTEGINEDPNNFIVAAPDLIIGQTQLALMQHMSSNNARYGAVFTNQFSGADRQYLTLETYSPNRGNYNDMWGDTYLQGINTAALIINNPDSGSLVKGIAQILQGAMFCEMAALYGDVPFSQAVQPDEFEKPAYDDQASVMTGGMALIATGINNVGSASISAGFGGNRLTGSTWAEAGYTLHARYALLNGDYKTAKESGALGISSSANNLMTQHGTSVGNRNLYYQFVIDEGQDYLKASSGGNNSHLVNLLDGTVTRKLPASAAGQKMQYDSYFYTDSGGDIAINTEDDGRFAMTAPFPIASYQENQLIMAEAAAKSGNDAGALTHLNNFRTDLVAHYGATAADFPASTASGAALLNQILEEKYIALVGELVTFHDLRRTRNLIGVPNKTTGSVGASAFPQKFLYPQSELDTNAENVPQDEFFTPTALFTSY